MKNMYLLVVTGLVVASLSLSAIAQNPDAKPRRPGMMLQGRTFSEAAIALRLKEKLELTAEQVTKLEAVVAKTEAADKAVQEKREALHKAVQAKALEAAIRTAATELGVKLGDQAVLQVCSDAETDAILTAAQKTTFAEIKAKRQERRDRDGLGDGPDADGRPDRRRARDSETDFAKIDSDGNGAVSLEEFKAYGEQMRQRRGGGRSPMDDQDK